MILDRNQQNNQISEERSSKANSFRNSQWWLVIGVLLFLACIQGASAFSSKGHYDLTVDALKDEGISIDQPQVEYITEMNNMVDMISKAKETDYADIIDKGLVPDLDDGSGTGADNEADDAIEQQFSSTAHFQNFENYTELNAEWIRLQEETFAAVTDAADRGDTRQFLAVLGMSLHTCQDFYAHSTWAEDTLYDENRNPRNWGDVTWFNVSEQDKANLTKLNSSAAHKDINKDYLSRFNDDPIEWWGERAHRQAYYASRQWIQMLHGWANEIKPGFWEQAMAPDIDTSDWGTNLNDYSNDFFWGLASFVGAWSSDYSTSYVDLGTWLLMFNGDSGYYNMHVDLFDGWSWDPSWWVTFSDDYANPWLLGKNLGSMYLYNPDHPDYTDPAYQHHPVSLEKVDEVRWLRIDTFDVRQTDTYSWDIDPLASGEADFYPIITVNGHKYFDAPWQGDDHLDATQLADVWIEDIPLPMDLNSVEVRYALWDDDHPVTNDDHCDIEHAFDQQDWIRTLYTGEEKTTVDTNGKRNIKWGFDRGDGDEAEVQFTYEFVPLGTGSAAALGLQIEASPGVIHSGDEVTYTYTVTNEGDRVLSNIAITDKSGLIPAYQGGDTNNNQQLDLTETWTYTASRVVTSDDHEVTSTVTVTATDATGSVSTVTTSTTSIVYVLHPAIQVEKTASSENIDRGQSVTYTYTVSNTGDTRLLIPDMKLDDDKVTPTYVSGDTNNDGYLDVADPGDPDEGVPATSAEIWTYTATSSPTHTTTNTVTASGTDDLGWTVDSTDSVTVVVTVLVNIDINPGGCPNGFGMKQKGMVPVAILGGLPDYTLDEIDLNSIQLNGIPISIIHSADVATPYLGTEICGCHNLTADGTLDAMFQVDAQKVARTLGAPAKKASVPLTLTGTLTDGITLIKGSDCAKIAG